VSCLTLTYPAFVVSLALEIVLGSSAGDVASLPEGG
jgi:hypothetical protein